MATIEERLEPPLLPTNRAGRLLEARPLLALVMALLVTGGHTMNLRETGVSQGWVAAEVYSLQSCYLVSLALAMLAGPALGKLGTYRGLTLLGLTLGVVGGIANGIEVWLSLHSFLVGRVLAGAGAGLVIYFAPRLLDPRWQIAVIWSIILCPVAGPGVISLATMWSESSDWQHGFLAEGLASAIGFLAVYSMTKAPARQSPAPRTPILVLALLIFAAGPLLYVLHWGQLQGWMESTDVAASLTVGLASLAAALVVVWPHLDWRLLGANWLRLTLFFFGGACQFFYGYMMNIYGGTIVNLSSWQRALLIWPMPIGMALGLAASHFRARRGFGLPGMPGAAAGLLLLAVGSYFCYVQTMEWPYWSVRDVVDLNWFTAPGSWELAPGRFLMGLGIGLFMFAVEVTIDPDSGEEKRFRPFLPVVQFLGGGLAAAVLINFLIIGHKVHYSYSAERDAIQSEELVQREVILSAELHKVGQPTPDRSARVLLDRFIHYEADNLVFATIYATFAAVALALAGLTIGAWISRLLHDRLHPQPVSRARFGRRRHVPGAVGEGGVQGG